MRRVLIFIILTILLIGRSQAQLILTLATNDAHDVNEGWSLLLENDGREFLAYLNIKYLNQTGEDILTLKSQPLSIQSGKETVRPNKITIFQTDYASDEVKKQVKRLGTLPAGLYQICISVIAINNSNNVSMSCQYQSIASFHPNDNREESNKLFSSSGNLVLQRYHAHGGNESNLSTDDFTRLYGQSTINILGIPFQGNVRLSNEKNVFNTSPQMITLSFDADQFKQNLRKRIEEKCGKVMEEEKLKYANEIARLQELENLEAALPDSLLQTQQERIYELRARLQDGNVLEMKDSLKHLQEHLNKNDSMAQHAEVRMDSLKNKIHQYEKWNAMLAKEEVKEREIEKLVLRREQLKQFKKSLELANKLPALYDEKDMPWDDPNYVRQRLKEEGMLNKFNNFLFDLESFEMGTFLPEFPSLMLQGMPVNGIGISISPSRYYTAVAIGTMQKASFTNSISSDTVSMDGQEVLGKSTPYKVIAVRAGYGLPSQNHLHLVSMDSQAPGDEKEPSSTHSKIYGVDWQVSLFSPHVILQNQSVYNSSLGEASSITEQGASISDLVVRNNSGTSQLKCSYRYVGKDYSSVGAPFLRNGRRGYGAQWDQSLLKRKLRLSSMVETDEYSHLQDSATVSIGIDQYGLGVTLQHINKWPQLQANFNRVVQHAITDTYRANNYQLLATKSYQGTHFAATSMLSYNMIQSKYDSSGTHVENHQVRFSQFINRAQKISFALSMSWYYRSNVSIISNRLKEGSFEAIYSYPLISQNQQWMLENTVMFGIGANLKLSCQMVMRYETYCHPSGRVQVNWLLAKRLQAQFSAQLNDENSFLDASLSFNW